jgi:hypothetical protein
MTPPWSGPIQTAWKACFWLGSTLVLLSVTGGIWKTDLKVANPEFLLPTFCTGIVLLLVPAFVAVLEALKSHSSKTIATAPVLSGFKVAFKEPQPDQKHAPPIKLKGTINKKLPEGFKLWLVNEGSGSERWPQDEARVLLDSWRNWSVEYRPANFSDNDGRTLRIYLVGQDGQALIEAYKRINRFHTKPGDHWPPMTERTKDMGPVSPTFSFKLALAKAP